MKKQKLAKVVRSYGKIIADNSRKIPGGFDMELIHDLRVAYKKLRAFVRLMQEEERSLQIPDELKLLYRSCGTVRDLQLVIKKLKDHSGIIPQFIKGLHHELFTAKELLVLHIEDIAVRKAVKEIEEGLPAELTEEMVRHFIERKVATINILLLALEHEDELHAIRKALKDLVYVKKILESDLHFNYPFSEWKNDAKLEGLTTQLGELNDAHIALSFFDTKRIEEAPAEEKTAVQQIRQQWEEEKKQQMLNAMEAVRCLDRFFKTATA
ncbi:CHAD domain-containing protein [Pseudobacter ginsenosidimutans]|jgi:CHAD domain-containing protein|uniref:CHAD domain-containing protein n=1 Tax=Pseudobacter ginsenosidimutans TaxID=661488 RepID=A0A4Q7MZ41_9BACT|nr:CHAD domain-containing protein [Pseudobacter ginsenosidimutans]QEC40818.1 CHAD domain-containing protein [Pseudobacter ginsenosidimutans]RZS72450.1 CHAD domain-containing protein [Pseudobacter ginsenosidimutans]